MDMIHSLIRQLAAAVTIGRTYYSRGSVNEVSAFYLLFEEKVKGFKLCQSCWSSIAKLEWVRTRLFFSSAWSRPPKRPLAPAGGVVLYLPGED